jgi:Putative F0F1-ATPase subunit Ca2+/Mg2+ transporter
MAESPENNDEVSPLKKASKATNAYAKYSGMAFQMLGTIGLGVYGGIKLDERQQNRFPVWTLLLSLGSVTGSLYMFIKQIRKE